MIEHKIGALKEKALNEVWRSEEKPELITHDGKISNTSHADRLEVKHQSRNPGGLGDTRCRKAKGCGHDEIELFAEFAKGAAEGAQRSCHRGGDAEGAFERLPQIGIAGELQKIFLGSDRVPLQAGSAVGVVRGKEEDRGVTAILQPVRQPDERVHITFAAERHKQNAERARQGDQRRSSAGSEYSF